MQLENYYLDTLVVMALIARVREKCDNKQSAKINPSLLHSKSVKKKLLSSQCVVSKTLGWDRAHKKREIGFFQTQIDWQMSRMIESHGWERQEQLFCTVIFTIWWGDKATGRDDCDSGKFTKILLGVL